MLRFLFAFFLATTAVLPAQAGLRVFTCEPEWQALVQELGGEAVEAFSATTAMQDPHHIDARPSLIAKLRRADLLVCTGAGLEAGWLPPLLRSAGNGRVQPGQSGYFEAAAVVTLLDVPASIDRAQGDVHPQGNPHLHLDPRNILAVAAALSARLRELDAPRATHYRVRHTDFEHRWRAAITRWEQDAAPLRGMAVVYHHRNWIYLGRWLGLKEAGVLEPKPGLPPGAAHLSQLLVRLGDVPARAILRAPYEDDRPDRWLAERARIPAITLPYTVGADGAGDLFQLFDTTLARLKAVAP